MFAIGKIGYLAPARSTPIYSMPPALSNFYTRSAHIVLHYIGYYIGYLADCDNYYLVNYYTDCYIGCYIDCYIGC